MTNPTPMSQQPQPLPESARARLGRAQQAGRPFFTSDLSVNEFVLTTQSGFQPLGLVMGTCIYHVGHPDLPVEREPGAAGPQPGHVPLPRAGHGPHGERGRRAGRRRGHRGADPPAQLCLRLRCAEFIAVGTAIKADDGASYRTPQGRPFTSHLSGQDFWTLHRHGWMPRAMVLGTCVYHIAHMTFRQMLANVGQNVELTNFSQAAYDAREIAMARMQYEAEVVGADGVVGVSVTESAWAWGEHAIEFFALGTAVSRGSTRTRSRSTRPWSCR